MSLEQFREAIRVVILGDRPPGGEFGVPGAGRSRVSKIGKFWIRLASRFPLVDGKVVFYFEFVAAMEAFSSSEGALETPPVEIDRSDATAALVPDLYAPWDEPFAPTGVVSSSP